MHRIDTRMYISRRDVFRKGAKPFRNCFPSPPRGKPGNLLILDTSHWFTSVTRLVQTILSLSPSLSSQLFPSIFPLSLRISHALSPFFQPIYLPLSPSVRKYLRKSEAKKERKILLLGNAWKRSNSRSFPRLDFPGSRAKRGCGKLLLRAVVLGRLEGRK